MYLFVYYARLLFCLFWVCWVPRGFSGGPGQVFLCVGLRCVECRSGTIYLSASLEWVAGLYRFSSFGLCCGGYGTIEIVWGCGPFFFAVFSLLSALSAGGCLWWGSILLIIVLFGFIFVLFVGLVFYKLLILF